MSNIKQLPQDVANQISAGEVVERPASVVKELVENSIDAESNKIRIEVKEGGKKLIRVKDNGHGIEKEEMELAFSRYATSKINKVSDIYSLKTLGFRGEALASIAAVSKVKALSRKKDAVKGLSIELEGGELKKKEIVGCPQGTDISVSDLFFNTPARFKYMKTVSTEFNHISRVVTGEALPYSEIKFNLSHNSKSVISTPGTGDLKDTIYALYGKELTEKLISLNFEDRYIKLKGYIAHPSFTRSSRIHEMFFVNKRLVSSGILSKGVEEGYRGFIDRGKFPVVFLFIELNPILVDVNVHPAKKKVEFSRKNIIKEVVKKGINKRLKNEQLAVKHKFEKQKENDGNDKLKYSEKSLDNFISEKTKNDKFNQGDFSFDNFQVAENKISEKRKNIRYNYNNEKVKKKKDKTSLRIDRIMGQIFGTYIISAGRDGLYIIDQHNAHERILFDNFYKNFNNDSLEVQQLLTPVNIELTAVERELIENNREELQDLGFKIENFGGDSFLVQQVPTIIKEKNAKEVVREIIDNLINDKKIEKRADLIEEIIKYMACRGAVKAEVQLSKEEMKNIVEGLMDSSNPYRCPHGRPIILHVSREDMDRGVER